ncbi:MAG: hypothetical protein KDK40_05225 [Chlamydiia bacterium]|nr:hypothetical protein [Chlamydiia bacterium]
MAAVWVGVAIWLVREIIALIAEQRATNPSYQIVGIRNLSTCPEYILDDMLIENRLGFVEGALPNAYAIELNAVKGEVAQWREILSCTVSIDPQCRLEITYTPRLPVARLADAEGMAVDATGAIFPAERIQCGEKVAVRFSPSIDGSGQIQTDQFQEFLDLKRDLEEIGQNAGDCQIRMIDFSKSTSRSLVERKITVAMCVDERWEVAVLLNSTTRKDGIERLKRLLYSTQGCKVPWNEVREIDLRLDHLALIELKKP